MESVKSNEPLVHVRRAFRSQTNIDVNPAQLKGLGRSMSLKVDYTIDPNNVLWQYVEVSNSAVATLGKGSYGKVKLVRSKATGRLYAVKVISKSAAQDEEGLRIIRREIINHEKLDHKNIVQLIESLEDEDALYVVMEYAASGTLFQKIRKERRITEERAKGIFAQIVTGIAYMHEQGLIHRDLKPENVLFDNENIKICDFGWWADGNEPRTTFWGTLDYMPPEMIKEIGHGYKLDIWALGVLLYEMTQGRVPFNGALDKDKASAVCALRYTVPSKSSQSLQNLIGQCLRYKPEERPTAEEILMHPWFGRFNSMMGKQVTGTYGICEINEITDSKVQLLYKNGDHEVVTFQKAKELVFQAEEKIRQDHESAQRLQEEVALLLLPQPEEDEDKQKGIFNGSSSGESVNSENIDQIDVALMQKPPGGTMSQFASPRKFSLPGSSQPVSPSSNVATPQKYSLPVDSTGACPSPGGRGPINNMKSITPSPGDYRPSYKSHGSDIVPEDDHDATITQLRSHIDKLQETCVPEQATSPRIKDFSLSAVIGEDMESEAPTFFEELSIIKEYEETNSQLQERILQLEWLQAEIDAELAQKRFLVEKYQERRKRQTKKSGLFNAVSRLFGCSSRYRQ